MGVGREMVANNAQNVLNVKCCSTSKKSKLELSENVHSIYKRLLFYLMLFVAIEMPAS